MRWRGPLLALLGVSTTACSMLVDETDWTGGVVGPDASGPSPSSPEGSADRGDAGAAPDADTATADAGDCPGAAGPRAVRVSSAGASYCIDVTEVTNAHYAAFLTAVAGKPRIETIGACAGDASYVPTRAWPAPPGSEARPVTYVDFCDALAFCTWAGKRLCGKLAGAGGDDPDPAKDTEWARACSGSGAHLYPYGNDYADAACHDDVADGPRDVGSLPGCSTRRTGLFDMSGNVAEWEHSCAMDNGALACAVRGGSFAPNTGSASPTGSGELTCESRPTLPLTHHGPTVGFRCCGR